MTIGREIVRLGGVTSTMDVCEAYAADGAGEGLVVVADVQTAGRGRAGRTWAALPGDALLTSILLRPAVPAKNLGQLPLIAGVAVANAIESIAPVKCQLKWPNDVLIDGEKVAGILVQSRLSASSISHVIVGIGVNVSSRRETLPDGATSISVSSGMPADRESLLTALFEILGRDYAAWLGANGRVSLDPWRSRAAFLGEQVQVILDHETVDGTFDDVDDDGRLLLRSAGGERRRLSSGEIQRGPRPLNQRVIPT